MGSTVVPFPAVRGLNWIDPVHHQPAKIKVSRSRLTLLWESSIIVLSHRHYVCAGHMVLVPVLSNGTPQCCTDTRQGCEEQPQGSSLSHAGPTSHVLFDSGQQSITDRPRPLYAFRHTAGAHPGLHVSLTHLFGARSLSSWVIRAVWNVSPWGRYGLYNAVLFPHLRAVTG